MNTMKDASIKYINELAKLDIFRERRAGIPEVVLAKDKKARDVAKILTKLAEEKGQALATKCKDADVTEVKKNLPEGYEVEINRDANTILVRKKGLSLPKRGCVGILAAGTADIPIAEETKVTLESAGCEVVKAYDVGIAGIHRVFQPLMGMIKKGVDAIVVVAGMEGALPSVVASLVDVPVIGVPTSTGYGVGADGTAALSTMLNSCSPGLTVVNIDNGFGAGALSALVASPRITISVGAIVRRGEEILLVKHDYDNYWKLPSGKLDFGEELREAAKREIREDTGLEVEIEKHLITFERIDANANLHLIYVDFLASVKDGNLDVGSDIAEAKWVSSEEIPNIRDEIHPDAIVILRDTGFI